MIARDRYGKILHIGDWVLYPWKDVDADMDEYAFYHGQIIRFNTSHTWTYVWNDISPSTTRYLEKLPKNEKKREQILFLRKLENITVVDLEEFFKGD